MYNLKLWHELKKKKRHAPILNFNPSYAVFNLYQFVLHLHNNIVKTSSHMMNFKWKFFHSHCLCRASLDSTSDLLASLTSSHLWRNNFERWNGFVFSWISFSPGCRYFLLVNFVVRSVFFCLWSRQFEFNYNRGDQVVQQWDQKSIFCLSTVSFTVFYYAVSIWLRFSRFCLGLQFCTKILKFGSLRENFRAKISHQISKVCLKIRLKALRFNWKTSGRIMEEINS